MPDLALAHPRSIDVAIAVRDAFDREELHGRPQLPKLQSLVRAMRILEEFRPLVFQAAGVREPSDAVLLVESGLWARYRKVRGKVRADLHVSGPLDGEPVLITSEAVIQGVVDGSVAPKRAVALGVMRIDR